MTFVKKTGLPIVNAPSPPYRSATVRHRPTGRSDFCRVAFTLRLDEARTVDPFELYSGSWVFLFSMITFHPALRWRVLVPQGEGAPARSVSGRLWYRLVAREFSLVSYCIKGAGQQGDMISNYYVHQALASSRVRTKSVIFSQHDEILICGNAPHQTT